MGDTIITGIDEKRFCKNRLVKVHDFRGAILVNINQYIFPILKKKPNHIILHFGTNDFVFRILSEILDHFLQRKSAITMILPNCKAMFLQVVNTRATWCTFQPQIKNFLIP